MQPAFLALLLAFLALLPARQQLGEPPTQQATIEGRVVKTGTEEPLKKAWLMLHRAEGPGNPYSTSTDSSGRFIFKDVPPGRYNLWAERNGFVRQVYGQRGPNQSGTTLTLGPGQTLKDIVFRLIPAAVITGRVYDEDGEPVAGALVQVMRYGYRQGKRELLPAGSETERSNDLGEYRISGLAPGQYYVSAVSAPAWGRSAAAFAEKAGGKTEESYPPTYYPGTNDPARATPLELRPGEVLGAIDIGFMPTRAVRIRGRVFNAVTGAPGRGAEVMLLPRESGVRRFTTRSQTYVDDTQGAFELPGVTPGSYDLEAHWWSENTEYHTRLALEVGTSDVEGINLVINPGVQMSGRVRVEGEAPVKLTTLHAYLELTGDSIVYMGQESSVKADGSFVLSNVSEGEYRVALAGLPQDCYLKSARLGGEDVLEGGLKVMGGKSGGSLELVVSAGAGRIEGIVLNAEQQPVAGAHVVLVPELPRRHQIRLYQSNTTDQYGRFTLGGISPGDYKLFSWAELEREAYEDPDFLKLYEEWGTRVQVGEAGRPAVQLRLIPAGERTP